MMTRWSAEITSLAITGAVVGALYVGLRPYLAAGSEPISATQVLGAAAVGAIAGILAGYVRRFTRGS